MGRLILKSSYIGKVRLCSTHALLDPPLTPECETGATKTLDPRVMCWGVCDSINFNPLGVVD